ncbi:MAG: ABC transporter permease [Spirochaetaceae bacterium]|jgi:ribose/xylose/arabinose/galactoside ABC-type transport system permease subunit|nr:ABC transporter permease [Spirochaetaceae bacterium]
MAELQKAKVFGMDQTELNLFMRRYGIGFVMLLMIAVLAIASPAFRTADNVLSVLLQVSINGILSLGMVFVMIAGGIDISIGSMLALTSSVAGMMLIKTGSITLAILVSVAATAAAGLMNGLLVARFKMFPFVVTLATQLVFRGAGYFVTGGYARSIEVPQFKIIGTGRLFGVIPYPIIIFLAVAALAFLLLHWTKLGRYCYAVGGNINAATASGVNVPKTLIMTYVISGICCGIAGIIMTSRINASQPNSGVGYETDAIAACVIGGASFAGGIGTIPGTIIGIIIIGLIYNGMNLLGISSYWQTIMKGLLIVGAVMLDMLLHRKK